MRSRCFSTASRKLHGLRSTATGLAPATWRPISANRASGMSKVIAFHGRSVSGPQRIPDVVGAQGSVDRVHGLATTAQLDLLRSAVEKLERSRVALLHMAEKSEATLAALNEASGEFSRLREGALHVAATADRVSNVIRGGDIAAALCLRAELEAERRNLSTSCDPARSASARCDGRTANKPNEPVLS